MSHQQRIVLLRVPRLPRRGRQQLAGDSLQLPAAVDATNRRATTKNDTLGHKH